MLVSVRGPQKLRATDAFAEEYVVYFSRRGVHGNLARIAGSSWLRIGCLRRMGILFVSGNIGYCWA